MNANIKETMDIVKKLCNNCVWYRLTKSGKSFICSDPFLEDTATMYCGTGEEGACGKHEWRKE